MHNNLRNRTASLQRTKGWAPSVSIVQRFHCRIGTGKRTIPLVQPDESLLVATKEDVSDGLWEEIRIMDSSVTDLVTTYHEPRLRLPYDPQTPPTLWPPDSAYLMNPRLHLPYEPQTPPSLASPTPQRRPSLSCTSTWSAWSPPATPLICIWKSWKQLWVTLTLHPACNGPLCVFSDLKTVQSYI